VENEKVIVLNIVVDQSHFDFLLMMGVATEIAIITFINTVRPFRTELSFVFGRSINLFHKVMRILAIVFLRTRSIVFDMFT